MSITVCCSAALSAGQLTLAAAQRLEEQTLQKALRLRRDEVGPPAGLATPSQDLMSAPTFSFRLPPRPQAADQSQGSPQTEAGPSTTADQPGTAAVSEQQAGQNQKGSGRVLQWRAQTLQHDSTSPDNEEGHTAPPGFVAFGSSKS